MIKGPSFGALYHDGIRPQRMVRKRRPPSAVTTATGLVGQILKRGLPGTASNSAAMASLGWVMTNRPHMASDYRLSPY